jgi:hypothetical protein
MANPSKAMCVFLLINEQSEKLSRNSRIYKKALSYLEREKQITVMKEELNSLQKHNTYHLAKLLLG